jgi:hypothetical protein
MACSEPSSYLLILSPPKFCDGTCAFFLLRGWRMSTRSRQIALSSLDRVERFDNNICMRLEGRNEMF